MPQLALWPRKSALAPDVLQIRMLGYNEGVMHMKGAFAPDVEALLTYKESYRRASRVNCKKL
jgi:hypothetical protein